MGWDSVDSDWGTYNGGARSSPGYRLYSMDDVSVGWLSIDKGVYALSAPLVTLSGRVDPDTSIPLLSRTYASSRANRSAIRRVV